MTAPLLLVALLAQQGGAAVSSDPAQAVIQLQKAIRQNPDVESNYTELGHVLLRTQNFNEAALVLEAARVKFPKSAQAALSAGVAYYGLRRFDDAVVAFLDAGRLDPDAEQPIAFLYRLPENWGDRKDDVVHLFSGYVKRRPESAAGHLALGRASEDVAELRTAIRLNPRSSDAHIELGSVLETKRDFVGAIAAFRKAADLAPRNPVPHMESTKVL
jgi:cytochrome c-type biogenesis protein CcmH/NrfG